KLRIAKVKQTTTNGIDSTSSNISWKGLHGTYLSLEKEVKENCFDNVVHVVGKGNLCTPEFTGYVKKRLPSCSSCTRNNRRVLHLPSTL
ncbi:MAG: hypothetical protein MZV70_12315, partial [Desulfobacterales bacterium]|nr:hypothetical protein [Desulfobacterales bacterium]